MPSKPVGVDLARAKIFGRAKIESVAPSDVRVPAGKPFELRLLYDLQEASSEKEEYVFELITKVGEGGQQTKKIKWGDKWGLPQSVVGYITQPYTLDTPGAYEVSFTARATYAKRRWLSRSDPKRDEQVVEGRLHVTVE